MSDLSKKEIERLEVIEGKVQELGKYLKDWAITDPETTLILGNVRRLLGEVYDFFSQNDHTK